MTDSCAVQADIAEIGQGFITLTFSDIDVWAEPDTDAGLPSYGWATITPLNGPSRTDSYALDGLVAGRETQ